ncbi:hypothetical protein Tco_1329730 [Tanacetum coccineum]
MYLTASRPKDYGCSQTKLAFSILGAQSFDLGSLFDSDYAGAILVRKSTTGGCQFLGRRLILWQCKKQTIVATSTTEAEYVAAVNCCGQVLWIHNQMLDYGFNFMNTKIYIDNESTIFIVKNLVFHSKTKHMRLGHHFIRDAYEKKLIQVLKIHTNDNVADLLTKAFDVRDQPQVPRDSLEGSDGSKGDQVQSSNDRPHSGGKTSERAEAKDAQAAEILKLKTRIKKLEKKEENAKPRPTLDAFDDLDADLAHGIDYMEIEEAVNEGRQSNETKELNLDVDTKVIAEDKGSGKKGGSIVSTARPEVDTARPDIDTARPEVHTANAPVSTAGATISIADPEVSVVEPRTPPTTTSIFDDEDITMAQTLIKMKEEKLKEKGVAFKDVKDSSRPVRSITTLKPLPSIDPKDKVKGILVEEEPVKIKRKDQGIDQIKRDEELAHKLHEEELVEIARIQEEKAAQEEASRVAKVEMFNEVQAGIDADALFTAKLQQEEREEYTIKEKEKFLAETIAAQRKFRAAQRAVEIRSRPPTKSQLRNLMMTYLKNMDGYKHSQLKAKKFEEIQAMYERQNKRIDDFKPMDSDDVVKDSKKAAGEDTSMKEEVLKEPDSTKIESMNKEDAGERVLDVSTKRKGGPRMKRMSKRKTTESDLEEKEDLKTFLKIVSDKEGMIDYEVLEKRFPIINWESKFYHYDRHGAEGIYYRIFRFDGSSKWIKTFSKMVTRFDRLDLVELYNLVMQRFETITPKGVDLVLWGDLRTMFDANAEDELWQNQERWNIKSWNFYENYEVHSLTLEDGTEIHMLAERKYPLTKETLKRMMSLKLIVESASDSAYDLLRFIQKQIDEAGSHDGGEKDLYVLVSSPHNKWSSIYHV